MSKIALESNINGSGVFTIASPNSNVDRTLTLPDVDGTLLTEENQSILASFRNKIINGDMRISQRGTSIDVTSGGVYTLDRWGALATGANATATQGSYTKDSVVRKSLVITGAASNSAVDIWQRIEGLNSYTLANKSVTVSLDVFTTDAKTVTWEIYYADTVDIFSAKTFVTSGTFNTAGGSYESKSFTFNAPSQSNNGLEFRLKFGALVAAKVCAIGSVQLEEGSVATNFEDRPMGLELDLCKRYFQVYFLGVFVPSPNLYGVNSGSYFMRTTPLLTHNNISAVNLAVASTTMYATGFVVTIQANSSGNGQWLADFFLHAEL